MGQEERQLAEKISQSIVYARGVVAEITSIARGTFSGQEPPDEVDDAQNALRRHIATIFRDLGILGERLNLSQFSQDVRMQFKSYTASQLIELEYGDDDLDGINHPLEDAASKLNSLKIFTHGQGFGGLDVLRQILSNTAVIIQNKKIMPSREHEVQAAVYEILEYAFLDPVKDFSVPQTFKNYKPDMGVRSLKAAVEFKYVDTKPRLKSILDGIYADMEGYSGSDEWRTFFAVIYTTTPLATQAKLDADFRKRKGYENWAPILVNGSGGATPTPPPPASKQTKSGKNVR